ncbi:HU family DNA-binding protein [Thiocystis violascens]|uniref:Bacterial nucleoid DNA-binding protein n=1 Tax=Thiocystis violascens (strain ATCC 17096 / DSM 198 / 6111) TaxID=765911 RepID=I3YGT6_THIV6|nr:HU family DNA-binding protein [Thiocystis violascens]AFL76204.1 bacterial nucleoid DNA-binding protein [Thiocystis violascens DSM 198]
MTANTPTPLLTQAELIDAIADYTGQPKALVRDVFAGLFLAARYALNSGRRVRLPELGTLVPKAVPARTGTVNGVPYATPAGVRVGFRASQALKQALAPRLTAAPEPSSAVAPLAPEDAPWPAGLRRPVRVPPLAPEDAP